MTRWRKSWLGLAVAAGVAQGAWAQAPALPGAAAPAAAPGTAPGAMVAGAPGSADVAPAPPGGMLGNVIKACEYLDYKCKQCMCNSVLGQLMNNSLKPMSTFSGGLVPPLCPPNGVNPADLAKPSDSAAGAAARIKADEADAKARVAAVRYLGTVDCHYWPEAQDALINALRADRNECVRLAAAVALGNGCCCTPKTIIALNISVAGTDEDGNPSETSERVRGVAHVALSQCVERFPPPAVTGPKPELPPERPPEGPGKPPVPNTGAATKPGEKTKVVPAAYYERVAATPMPQVLSKARQSLQANAVTMTAPVNGPTPGAAKQGLLGIAFNAIASTTPAPAPPDPVLSDSAAPPLGPTRVIEVIPTVKKTTPPAPLAPVAGRALAGETAEDPLAQRRAGIAESAAAGIPRNTAAGSCSVGFPVSRDDAEHARIDGGEDQAIGPCPTDHRADAGHHAAGQAAADAGAAAAVGEAAAGDSAGVLGRILRQRPGAPPRDAPARAGCGRRAACASAAAGTTAGHPAPARRFSGDGGRLLWHAGRTSASGDTPRGRRAGDRGAPQPLGVLAPRSPRPRGPRLGGLPVAERQLARPSGSHSRAGDRRPEGPDLERAHRLHPDAGAHGRRHNLRAECPGHPIGRPRSGGEACGERSIARSAGAKKAVIPAPSASEG